MHASRACDSCQEHPPMMARQGHEWDTYSILETFLMTGIRDDLQDASPKGRGHGVIVVVGGVTTSQGRRESRLQGEG
jgi:hypothetical protein